LTLGSQHTVIIIGGGQAGLATAYYLRRAGVDFVVLDAEFRAGGSWLHGWQSLTLFSPAAYSSLPGWQMPEAATTRYPTRNEVIEYLQKYEARYDFPVVRPAKVLSVNHDHGTFLVQTSASQYRAKAIVSATGTWSHPFVPKYAGWEVFRGEQIHSANYVEGTRFRGKRVLIIGGGNSGAQILAEVSRYGSTTWVTLDEPKLLPKDVDGRVLFERASARIIGGDTTSFGGIGDIVMVASVKEALERGVLHSVRPFQRFEEDGVKWRDGTFSHVDTVIWCTGFRPALGHLSDLYTVDATDTVPLHENQSVQCPGLWLIGYGNWSGAASATMIGAGRVAREMVPRLISWLDRSEGATAT